MMEYHKYFFTDDGTVPNSHLPVIIYSQVVYNSSLSDWFENKFKENNWGNNWRDIVLPYDHFHSNTHEVLALSSGAVSLKMQLSANYPAKLKHILKFWAIFPNFISFSS